MEIKTLIVPFDSDARFEWLRKGNIPRGYGNGYVGVTEGHPWYGKDNDSLDVSVHGGLTWSGPLEGEDKNVWWLGFDTLHCNDTKLTCPKEYVEAQVESLKQQAEAALKQ